MTQMEKVLLDDEGNFTVKDGDSTFCFECLSCRKNVISKVEFKMKNVVCPHCKKKFKIRYYKNGRCSITARN